MNRCPTCNAPMEDPLVACTFCGAITPEGIAARKERARHEEELRVEEERRLQEEAARARAQAEADARRARQQLEAQVNGAGTQAIIWSLVSLLCCLPIGPIVGLVLSVRARRLAAEKNIAPGRATVGLAVAATALTLWSLFGVFVAVSVVQESRRKAELTALVQKGASAEQLDGATACALTELELIESRYEDYSNINNTFKCSGRVVQEGGQAHLVDSYFTGSEKRVEVVGCFTRAARWTVKQVRGDEDCDAPPPASKKKNGKTRPQR